MSLSEVFIFLSIIIFLVDMKIPVNESLEFDVSEDESKKEQLIHQERGSSSLSAFLAKHQKINRPSKEKMNRMSMWSPYNTKSTKTKQNTASFKSGNEEVIMDTMSANDLDD